MLDSVFDESYIVVIETDITNRTFKMYKKELLKEYENSTEARIELSNARRLFDQQASKCYLAARDDVMSGDYSLDDYIDGSFDYFDIVLDALGYVVIEYERRNNESPLFSNPNFIEYFFNDIIVFRDIAHENTVTVIENMIEDYFAKRLKGF